MANPNIAALTELYGGTLAWELEPQQPVYAYNSSTGQSITNWSNLDGSGNMDINSSFTIPDTLDNRVTIVIASSVNYWSSEVSGLLYSGYPSIYNPNTSSYVVADGVFGQYPGDPIGTGNGMQSYDYNQGAYKMFYWLDSSLGAGGSGARLRWTTGSWTGNQGSKFLHYHMAHFYNVNQTSPFKYQLKETWGGDSYSTREHITWSSTSNNDMLVTASPGDLAYLAYYKQTYHNIQTVTSHTPSGESDPKYLYANGSYGGHFTVYYKSVNTSEGEFGNTFTVSYGNSNYGDDGHPMQGADAATLFTVPTGYVVKVNQIYASAAQAGLAFQAQVNGLAAYGATPNTIHDSADSDIITTNSSTPNGAVGTIASGVAITPGVQTKALTQPVWLAEGNGLAAAVSFSEPDMSSSTLMKPAPKAYITISMEVIKT